MTSSDLTSLLNYASANHYMQQPFIKVLDQYQKDLQELFSEALADDELSFMKDEGLALT